MTKMWSVVAAALCLTALVAGKPGVGPGEQDWNYVEVRPGAHMFYWLYYTNADVNYLNRPLVIWLQGGPGASSMYGNFEELGIVDLDLQVRNLSWVNEVNVLFIDNPVGTGWSYVDDLSLLTTTNLEVALDLVTFTNGFYTLHPEFLATPLYIFCESYGGKMAPEFALELDKAIVAGQSSAPLMGVALGNPWTSPIDSTTTWAQFLKQTAMVDTAGYNSIVANADLCQAAVDAGDWELATDEWGNTEFTILRAASNIDFYNILYEVSPAFVIDETPKDKAAKRRYMYETLVRAPKAPTLEELMNGPVRVVLGATIPPQVVFDSQGGDVFNALYIDFMKPATNIVEQLLTDTILKVVVFSGHLDLIVDTPGTLDWVERLQWPGAAAWNAVRRNPLTINNIIEGYTKKSGLFSFYWLLRAGHMVPTDNPEAALLMLQEVTQF